MKSYRTIIFIAAIVGIALYLVIPNNPGFFGREIYTHLGLDLVGGAQVLLEANLPEGQEVTSEQMETALAIIEDRVNGLGLSETVVQRAGDRFIVVEIPDVEDPLMAEAAIKETALLEFVDFSDLSSDQAFALEGMRIETDYIVGETEEVTSTAEILPSYAQRTFNTVMTGDIIDNAGATSNQLGGYEVAFQLTGDGTREFSDYTQAHVGNILAIVLDKVVISAPRIENAITTGQGVISGNFTLESANKLAVQLRYGRLPVPLKVVENRTIGPSLGEDSLDKSVVAGVIGMSLVMLFMMLYYRLPGILACVAILIYAVLTFALFRFIPVTLTLPGIAGLMLSTGSALDANILIFERLKEELRSGRTLKQAVDLAWERALPSIRDSNISTLITCAILYWFGSAFGATIVKGFSLTLALGVLVSLFTAIVVTRTFLSMVLGWIKKINLETWFGI
ncbi:MAG: protein translocase subunit SecD [Chloroflexi bacterium]|nr:MAG: protein translocase subunit SecD [Chloroflexota bacterium]